MTTLTPEPLVLPRLHSAPRLIVLEGPDNTGKSTLAQNLADHIHNSVVVRFPGETSLGKELRELLLYRGLCDDPLAAQFLFLADMAATCRGIVAPVISQGRTVICDRWWQSCEAYRPGLFSAGTSHEVYAHTTARLQPDLTVFCHRALGGDVAPSDLIELEEYRPSARAERERQYELLYATCSAPKLWLDNDIHTPQEAVEEVLSCIS